MSVDLDRPREGCEEQALRDRDAERAVRINALNSAQADRDAALAQADKFRVRVDELLVTIRRLSQQMPYEEEKGSTATLIAEVGTLKARVAELERERDELKEGLESTACGMWDDGFKGEDL